MMKTCCGLTDREVLERRQSGRVNRTKATAQKPVFRIVAEHLFTLFNAVNAAIAAALIFVGSYHNLLFLGVAICNTAIGIVQELRSRRTLAKLSLLHAAKARVRRNGKEVTVPVSELVEDDCLLLESGDPLAVDAVVQSGLLEVNESLLTGEAATVQKQPGDPLLSGSFVVSGKGEATATRVGNNAYAAALAAKARVYKRPRSRLLSDVNAVIRFTSLFMIPFAALLLVRERFSASFDLQEAVTSTAAALLGMMPQGLILLTAVALMAGVLRLAEKRTLVQELYGVESLARVSLLCLDKTGTITTGHLTVCKTAVLSDRFDEAVIGAAIRAIGDSNPTAQAVCRRFPVASAVTAEECLPFSSDRKYSAVRLRGIGTVVFGAPDRLFAADTLPREVLSEAASGKRLLAVGFCDAPTAEEALQSLTPLAVLVLEDELRDNVQDILAYFQQEDVTLRVLSGDHPDTVSAIAARAGLHGAEKAVDATTLTTPDALKAAAREYVVFGRVTPEQKRDLIRCFKEQGHAVGMTGDGVNDVRALKEADCSVAVAAGSDAAKQVSRLVLLDSDFAALPVAVARGRRVINNITRTASLFLVKTVMSFLVTLCAVAFPMTYPFEPLQLTLIGMFAESIPGFFLTLEPNDERVKGRFLQTVLVNAVPSGVMIALSVALIQLLVAPFFSLSAVQSSTLCVYVTGFIWLVQLYRLCRPLTAMRRWLCILMTVGFFAGVLLLSVLMPAVFALPTVSMLLIFAVFAAGILPLDALLDRLTRCIRK